MTETYPNIDTALPSIAAKILMHGQEIGSRLGERTQEILHQQIVLSEPWRREVLVQNRGANIVAQIAETMWILAGRDDVEWLGQYLPRAKDFSDDGKVWRGGYGPRLRRWVDHSVNPEEEIDQVKHVIDLLAHDRSTRRAVISIYDPVRDTLEGKDIPCNDFLSFINRNGRLDMSVFVRSNDLIWGWSGINQFEWSALQEIMAGVLGLSVGRLVFNTTSLHIYDRHWQKADRLAYDPVYEETLEDSPRFAPRERSLEYVDKLIGDWFQLEHALRTGQTSRWDDVMAFPEPMLRSWLKVIAWYWTGGERYVADLKGTRLWAALMMSPPSVSKHAKEREQLRKKLSDATPTGALVVGVPSGADGTFQAGDKVTLYPVAIPPEHTATQRSATQFVDYVDNLHREKGAAYGDSWKKRGEQMSILANIARKIDRLDSGVDTSDETQADTAIDLLVYLCKYRLWLSETNSDVSLPMLVAGDEYDNLRAMLEWLADTYAMEDPKHLNPAYVLDILTRFGRLETIVVEDPHRVSDALRVEALTGLNGLIAPAFLVARARWLATASPDEPDYQNPYRNADV